MADRGIRLLVGLGNPGPEYEATRHNVGFWFLDRLAARHQGAFRMERRFQGLVCRCHLQGRDVRLLKPLTFMNRSGQSLGALVRYFGLAPEQILVAHDELDFPPGIARFKQGGGHGGHNGLRDIIGVLGTRAFWRLRIGIGHPGDRHRVVSYVLSRPSQTDRSQILQALEAAEIALFDGLLGDFQRAMNRLHGIR